MPKWVAEQNAKRKKEDKIVYKPKAGSNTKSQSSSANKKNSSTTSRVNDKASKSTFLGGGSSVQKTKKNYQVAERKRTSSKARQVAEEQKRRRELEQHQNQKMYGDQKRATPRRTTTTSNNLTQHTTAAQRQKMGMPTAEDLRQGREHRRALANNIKDSVRRATSEENRAFMQRQKSGTLTEEDKKKVERQNERRKEVAKNTGRAATKGVQDTLTGYGKTLADVDEMAKSNKNWTRAKASKMGISEDDTVGMAKVEAERQGSIKQAQELRRDLAEKQDKRQAEFDERTKNAKGLEKAWYGAVESGTGMATDALVGALTGTGTAGSLASMAARTYGTTRGQAEKEGATENEDRAYALLQAAKEVGTELLFPGAGLAKKAYGKAGLSVADRVADSLTKGMTGNKADLVGAGVRLLGGTAEENAEELAGWGLDPVIKELAYGKNVRTREAQKLLKQESDELRSNLKSAGDARSVAAYLGSDRFLADNIAQYKDAGLSDKQAREVAEKMRDYLTASLTGDTDRMGDLEDEIVTTVAGGSLKAMIKDYDVGELMDTFASTSVLTLATGLPATATTAMKGARIRENLGSEGLRALSQTAINFEDDEASLKGQAARDRLDSGKDLTSTQVYDLAKAQAEQIQKDEKRVAAMSNMADNAIKSEKLVTPKIGFRENGSVAGDEIITMNYVNESNNATEIISDLLKEEGNESLTDTEVQTGSRAIAGFKTGAFTVNDANALNYTNTTVRTAFEAATGVNLSQYVVRKNGQVDIPATNAATKDALFAMAADNFVKTAQAETANWMDSVKGDVVTQVTERMGAQGSLALQQALDDVDERDRSTYMMNANAADMMYQTARNMGTEWDSVKAEARKMFPDISETKLEAMYNAGLRDRADAANGAIGQQVRMGEAMALQNEPSEPKGKVFVDTTATPKGTVVRTFSEIASNLGVDIHLVDDLKTSTGGQANGQYVNGAIYINMNSDFESNIGYIFMHEVTHHLKQYAPEQFNELENLVREKWFGYNPEQMQNEIAKKIDLYKRNGQTLSEEEALEEIIADAAHEFINDRNFADQVAEQNPDIAKAILNGIRNALRMLRRLFAAGSIDDETHMNSLFSQLNILDEAEKLWLNAYTQAVQNKAAVAIDEWQDRANGEPKQSITTDKEDFVKGANLPKELRDWAKEMGLDKLSSQPVKGPVIVSVRDLRTAWYEKNGRADEANVINTALDKIGDSLTKLVGEYQYIDLGDALNAAVTYRTDAEGHPTSVILSCQVKNAEYEVNFDFTTICAKRLAMQKILERFIKTEGERQGTTLYDELKLDEEGLYKLRLILETAGFEVSCRGCFVEQNRYSQQNQARTIANDWNAALDEWAKDNGTEVTENFGLTTLDIDNLDYEEIEAGFERYHELMKGKKTDVATKNRMLIEASPFFRKRMNASDYASMAGQRALMAIGESKKGGTNLYGLLKRGQSDSKQSVPFTAYNGEISLLPDNMKGKSLYDYLLSIGGARAQSASDFQIEFVYDYMQMVADLSARGLPMHMYTKVIELAELFGMTGIKINLSAMCDVAEDLGGEYAGLKLVDGKYEYNISDQSIDYEKAVALQKKDGYSKNIGIIMVTLSSQHMLKSLDDPDVRYIIGYHSSAMPVVVANMSNMGGATDYTKINKTNKLNEKGKALFDAAMEEAKGNTELEKYKDALRIFDEKIQEETAKKKKLPRRGNEYGSYMSAYGGNTADFNTYDSLLETKDARKTADKYLEYCMKNDLIPIYFPFAFHENYYKCEIYDFNMYDNNTGEYAPMEGVRNIYPGLNMAAGETDTTAFTERVSQMMDEQNRVNKSLDSQYDAVFDEAKNTLRYSITGDDYMDFDASGIDHNELIHRADAPMTREQQRDADYMDAVNSGNMDEAQKFVDEAAKSAGYGVDLYHGTGEYFNIFRLGREGIHLGNTEQAEQVARNRYHDRSRETRYKWGEIKDRISEMDTEARQSLINRLERTSAHAPIFDGDISDAEAVRAYAEDALQKYYGTQTDINNKAVLMQTFDRNVGENVMHLYARLNNPFVINGDILDWTPSNIAEILLKRADGETEFTHWFDDEKKVDISGSDLNLGKWTRRALEKIVNGDVKGDEAWKVLDDVLMQAGNYSGIKYLNQYEGDRNSYSYIALSRNDIKSADTITYAEDGSVIPLSERFDPTNNDIRYSLPTTDADGNILTDGQMEYFKNSQARDEQGRLVPVYHVTRTAGFTVFDPSLAFDGVSVSFSNDIDFALNYSSDDGNPDDWRTAYENRYGMEEVDSDLDNEVIGHYMVYLNMENPLILEGDYLDEMDIYEWPVYAKDNGYDGVIYREFDDDADIYQVFNRNQIKDTRNENPTENPDIRYSVTEDKAMSHMAHDFAYDNSYEALAYYESLIDTDTSSETTYERAKKFIAKDVDDFYAGLTRYADGMKFDDPVLEEGRVRMARSKQDFFNSNKAKWNQSWLTEGEVLDVNSVKRAVRELVMANMQNSNTNKKYKADLVNKMTMDMRLAYFYAKQGRTDVADALLWHSAFRMVDGVEFFEDDGNYETYKKLRDYFKDTRIVLGEEYWSDTDYAAFRKANFGRLNLVRGNTNVDKVLDDLYHENPDGSIEGIAVEWFSPEAFEKNDHKFDSVPDILLQIADVLDDVEPYAEAYSSEYCAEWATDLAGDLLDIMQNGKELKSIADRYTNKYEAKIKAMKARHAEAMLKARQQREEGIRKERVKFKEYVEKKKEQKAHGVYFQRIIKTHKKLTERLLNNTADSNIPEQYKKDLARLLAAFDLQTVGSKKYESRTGRKGKKSIKLGEMKAILNNIENVSGEFHVNDAITDLIDDLLGKDVGNGHNRGIEGLTIDELNSSELARIDKLLRALLHEFNTYRDVKIGAKRQQVKDIGRAQTTSALEHAKIFGPGKDYNSRSLLGILDKILNMDEITPSYLFRRIDPNKEGLWLMYEQLEDSHDRYIRNTQQLTQWVEEIVGEYHHKGIVNKDAGELENWRSENYAQTFKLDSGENITLTPAQMMSIYCLDNREQAKSHMLNGGVVVAPVSYNARILSDLKKKANTALPKKLSDADIKRIKAALTPDQAKVAQKLQQLMADKMAAWGNEASMNVLGIELFGEPDYFPIKSDQAGLISDLSEDQFVEAIRSFGFTKAVKPGAGNAIMVNDIFDVVTEHCNNMNLYNAYSEAINDFMKVFNFKEERDEGLYSVKQAVAHAYSNKATTFIMSFMKDLNGNVSGAKNTGINDAFNAALANAKKASVFANIRVGAQQPTAIGRAFQVIDPKYASAMTKPEKGILDEMFEHCPIALWKSWGYYDINMGRNIEDVIMNKNNVLEEAATWAYGALDNMTWGGIWQMVKAETEDKHPSVEKGSDEYWDLCNRRMREVVAFTQVVDSPFHRSHAMRSKSYMDKLATAFGAEPTLTFNMVRDGVVRSVEMWKTGDKAKAGKLLTRTLTVFGFTAALTAAAAALPDVLRGKDPGADDDDDDERTFLEKWWANALNNFKDNVNLLNNIYYVKDVKSLLDGWEINNLGLQGFKYLGTAAQQLKGSKYVRSKDPWWKNFLYGMGYLTGTPFKTVMTDFGAMFNKAKDITGIETPLLDSYLESLGNISFKQDDAEGEASMFSITKDKSTSAKAEASLSEADMEAKLEEYRESLSDTMTDEQKDKLVKKYKKSLEEQAVKEEAASADFDVQAHIAEAQANFDYEMEKRSIKAAEMAAGKTGRQRDEALWDVISEGYTKSVDSGNMATIQRMREEFAKQGGDTEWFDAKIADKMKSAYKKTLYSSDEIVPGASLRQETMYNFMTEHGVSETEISDIVYHSYVARDLKAAMRIGNEDYIMNELVPLVAAGLSREDYEKLYKYRNMGAKTYDGKYTDPKYTKTTGTFVWPTEGVITSHFGWRNAPTAGASSNHPAIDIGAPSGTTVVAADGGVVITAGANGGYGNSVGIKHANGMVTYYNHLSAWNVKVGDQVAQGQPIANVGSTGISTGPHLDFKILDTDGNPVDPEKYLNKRS